MGCFLVGSPVSIGFKTMCHTMERKRDSFNGAPSGTKKTLIDTCRHDDGMVEARAMACRQNAIMYVRI